MSRKIGKKWYRRYYAEATLAEAEATAKSSYCSGYITRVVKEILHHPYAGTSKVQWSIFVRPKKFNSEKAAREWSRATAGMGDDDRVSKKQGMPYLTLAR